MDWNWLVNWVQRMASRFGGTVLDGGRRWDWGQAICRQTYGPDWMNSPTYLAVDIEDIDAVPDEVVSAAMAWERGEWPEWAGKA